MAKKKTLDLPFTLTEAVKEKRAVLVFGAGASKECSNQAGNRPPDGNQMRDVLAKKFLGTQNDTRDLPTVAEIAISNGAGQPQVFDEIAKLLNGYKSSKAHRTIADFSWRGIATTNYDRLIEQGYADNKNRKQNCIPFVKDTEPYQDRLTAEIDPVALLKLHGCIDHRLDPDIPLVLSHEHYRRLRSNRELLLNRLKDWAQNSVLIFIGYQIRDNHIRELIYDIDPKNRPQWYIVSPDPDEHDIKFWASKSVDVLTATFGEFTSALDSKIEPLFRALSKARVEGEQAYQKHFRTTDLGTDFFRQSLEADYDYIHSGMPFTEVEPQKFYSGYDEGWCGIFRQYDFRRKTGERLLYAAVDYDDKPTPKLFLLQGSAGAGKTIALKKAAYDASVALDQMVFWLKDKGFPRPEFFEELYGLTGKRALLFIDQISLHAEAVETILTRAKELAVPLTIVGSDREADWGSYCRTLEKEFPPLVFELKGLSETEAEDLVDLLERHKCLGMLESKPRQDRIAAFVEKDRSDRQLLVALHELTQGKPFEDIILEEYERIVPDAARRLYLDIATMHQFGVTARAGAISRISGIRFKDFEENFFQPLKDIVRVRWDGKTGDHGYEARHSKVAQIVFGVACEDDEAKAKQLGRVISGLDSGYSSDARIIEGVCKGRQISERFSSIDAAREIFEMACSVSPHSAFLFQQFAIMEYSHRKGSLDKAEELANTARTIDDNNHIYIHTQAEIARRMANAADARVKKEQLRALSRRYLNEIHLKNGPKDLTFCNLLVDEAVDLLRSLPEDAKDHQIIEFDDKVDEAVQRLQRADQDFPDTSEFSSVEARLWERLGEDAKAKSALNKAIKARPKHSGAFMRLAKIEKRSDQSGELMSKTLSVLDEGLAKFPNDKTLHLQKARALLEVAENPDQDIEFHLKSSFATGDHNFEARFLYAQYLFWCGRIADCKTLFQEIDKRSDKNFRTLTPKREDIITQKLGEYQGTVEGKREQFFFVRYGGYPTAIFSFWRSLSGSDYDLLQNGDQVSFRVRFNRKGPVAVATKKTS